MKLLKILSPKIIFYIVLIVSALIYYAYVGVDAENETDFLVTLIAITVLSVVTTTNIKSKIESLKE